MPLCRMMLAAMLLGATHFAIAQEYPTRPAKLVVAYTPGAENDLIARLAAQHLSEQLKQPFVVENRPGASGVIGADFVAKSAPDGYTLLLGNTTLLGIMGSLNPKLPYQPLDFEPVTIVATIPTVLVVSPSLQVNDIAELVALAKSKPGALNYASPGSGTPMHLTAELFAAQTAIKIIHVPYKGAAPAVTELIAGQVQLMFQNVPTVLAHVRGGKLKAIATANPTRLAVLPEVPTLGEVGVRDAESASWFAIVAPKGTPKSIVTMLQAEIARGLKKPDVRQRLQDLGADPLGSTPEESAAHVGREISKWARVIKTSGIKVGD
ncbi:MAG: tripartite tricarboxylate transporter substrate binding protein [Betaproteobacteria bacterium]|nr:tripartite tricarboxylate transporter substrate binding protein [Betaproteobacteria bacterium]